MKKHKFIATETGGTYGTRIFCEYCGHVAYNSNRSNIENLESQKIAKEPCAIGKE